MKFHPVGLVIFALILAPAAEAETSADIARIAAIESRLAPAVVTRGAASSLGTLASQMALLKVPAVSMAYIHDGRIAWTRAYGHADEAAGTPVTAETIFLAGSISKPVTAMAVMRLVQAGKLKLDVDVNIYLKTWHVPHGDFPGARPLTLRELLSHTSGVNVHGFAGYAQGEPIPTLVQVLKGEKPANSHAIAPFEPPGTEWRYSGGGYVIIQQLLQDVTGKSFPDLMQSLVLDPLGMTHSTYRQDLPATRRAKEATSYGGDGKPIPGGPHVYPEMSAAGLWTTPSDLALFAIEIQNALSGRSSRVINKATAMQMLMPGMGGWGLGLQVGGAPNKIYFTHGGDDAGFHANFVAYENGDGFVVMTNADRGPLLIAAVGRTVADEYHWPDLGPVVKTPPAMPPTNLAGLEGSYAPNPTSIYVVSRQGQALTLQMPGGPPQLLFPENDRVWYTASDLELNFNLDAEGRATSAVLKQGQSQALRHLSDDEAKALQAQIAKRLKDQTALPGSETALRKVLNGIRSRQPDYGLLTEGFAVVTRAQLPDLADGLEPMGELESVTFSGVDPNGADIYQLKFAHGAQAWRIVLDDRGRVMSIGIRPI